MSSGVEAVTRAYVAARRFAVRGIRYVFFCSIIVTSSASGKTKYYISSSTGNDANNGTSTSTPWKTLSMVPLYHSFAPGDSILLKRGDTLSGEFSNLFTGTAEAPIVIASYGTGGKPIVVGDLSRNTWTKQSGFSDIYKTYIGYNVAIVPYEYHSGSWNYFATIGGSIANYLSNPDSLKKYLSSFPVSACGPGGVVSETLWVRTTDGNAPTTAAEHIFRYGNFLDNSSYVIVRDLAFLDCFSALKSYNGSHLTWRNLRALNSMSVAFFFATHCVECILDSSRADSTRFTALYDFQGFHNTFRCDTVNIVQDNILGIHNAGEWGGIGLQEDTNTVVEHNTLMRCFNSGLDVYWGTKDTVRYNTIGAGCGSGIWPDGDAWDVHDNIIDAGGSVGIGVSIRGPGEMRIYNNTITNAGFGLYVPIRLGGGTTVSFGNQVTINTMNELFDNFLVGGITSTNNIFIGSGKLSSQGKTYSTLASFHSATNLEEGSVSYSGPPTGTFTVTPDSLPAEGGRVTLHWSTTNATSATISPAIGHVATNGSLTISVSATAVLTLAVTGPLGSTVYRVRVIVGTQSGDNTPLEYGVRQNYPNPFNPSTTIEFIMRNDSYASLEVFDVLGRESPPLVQGLQTRGIHRFQWNGEGKASGLYFYRFTAGTYTETRRMMLIR